MKQRVPAVENWFTMDEAAPQLAGARGVETGSYFWPTAIAVSANPSNPGEAREPALLSRRGHLWSWTTNHYAPPEPYVAPDPFVPYTVCAVELDVEKMVVLGQLATGADETQLEVGMDMELVLGPLYEDDEHEYVVWQWAPAAPRAVEHEEGCAMSERDIAILGAGMHPWGKWGRNFVEYGVVAAQAALADAGVEWTDVQFVSGGETVRNGYPGYVAGATFAQALGWNGAQVASSYAACASGATALAAARAQILAGFCDVALVIGADTTPKGFLAPNKGERGDDPDWLRFRLLGATNPTYFGLYARRRMELFGATREDFARVKVKNARHGLENPNARYRKEVSIDDVLAAPLVSDPLGLLDICATSDGAAAVVVSSLDYARSRGVTDPVRVRAISTVTPSYPQTVVELPNFATDSAAGTGEMPAHGFKESIAARAYEEAGMGPDDLDCAEVYDLSTAMELDWYEQIGLCPVGEAEKLLRDGDTTIGGRVPVNPSGGLACFGEAVPAQAISQVCELMWQIQGRAAGRQVEGAQVGLTINQGLFGHGSAVIVSK